MEMLHSPLTLALYLCAAALTVWGAISRRDRGRLPAFAGGLLWAAGTVSALVEGIGLDEVLCATLALLLLSAGAGKGRRRHE